MKRITATLGALALAGTMAACSTGEDVATPAAQPAKPAQVAGYIAQVVDGMDDDDLARWCWLQEEHPAKAWATVQENAPADVPLTRKRYVRAIAPWCAA